MKDILLVGAGGFMGSISRYGLSFLLKTAGPMTVFPFPALIVNLAGSILIGILFPIMGNNPRGDFALLTITGFCGGFTTFSTFSIENLMLLKNGLWLHSALYIFLSIVLCIGGAFGGMEIGNTIAN